MQSRHSPVSPDSGGFFGLRKKVLALLRARDFGERLAEWKELPARQVVNPLISFLCSTDETVKWRAVTALGVVVAALADADLEAARNIMRRLMWSLNDESGGIGWGAPEAMGEIMARSTRLAEEYVGILLSYVREDGNLLENDPLERGALWGLARVAEKHPALLCDASPCFLSLLGSQDLEKRGLALWVLGFLGTGFSPSDLETVQGTPSPFFSIYHEGELKRFSLSDLAARAARSLS